MICGGKNFRLYWLFVCMYELSMSFVRVSFEMIIFFWVDDYFLTYKCSLHIKEVQLTYLISFSSLMIALTLLVVPFVIRL